MIDATVTAILLRLREGGFLAYPVGGCVRDLLLGRRVSDWDVATSARPEQVLGLFSRSSATGLKHGTVTVTEDAISVEVTTFRTEGPYSDGRRPDSVRFVGKLEDDLARRDFTVNAMALDADGSLIDPFDGLSDLRNRVIRCVGDPRVRFHEDALRMWRAFRFSATLGFGIEGGTWDAVASCAAFAARLSAERVAAETQKILMSGGVARLSDALLLGLMDPFLSAHPAFRLPVVVLKKLPLRPDCRWAGLAALLIRAGCLSVGANSYLRALRLPNRVIEPASFGAERAAQPMPDDDAGWRRMCHRHGIHGALCAAAAADALNGAPRCMSVLRRVLGEKPCLSYHSLALSGTQLMRAGLEGPEIGKAQRKLMEHVLEHPENNVPETLWQILSFSEA